MRTCDKCERESVDGGAVECDEPDCPLRDTAEFDDDARYDPTIMEPRSSREEVLEAAMATLTEEERALVEERTRAAEQKVDEDATEARSKRPKTVARPPKLPPPPTLGSSSKAEDSEASVQSGQQGPTSASSSLSSLREKIRASKNASTPEPTTPSADDELPLSLAELEGEDETILQTDFDVDEVPIPDSISEASGPSYAEDETIREDGEDPTVMTDRPDLDEIREAARVAAREMQGSHGGEDEFDVGDTVMAESLVDVENLPSDAVLPDVENSGPDSGLVLSEDPNFGQPPYQVIHPAAGRAGPTADETNELETSGIARWVDVDSARDLVVLLLAVVGCASATHLAVANWWSAAEVAVATFGAIIGACAVVGTLLVGEKTRSNRVNVAIKSAGIAAPFALISTLAWASGDVRLVMFEWTEDPDNVVVLQKATEDSFDAVAERACRLLAQEQTNHNFVIGAIDERPEIADGCMSDPSSANHRVAANRLAAIWQSRMQSSGDPKTCEYVEHYAQLPVAEVDKFYDVYACAFSGNGEETEECCAEILLQSFGKGIELIPGLQLASLERNDSDVVHEVLAPVLYPEQLDETGRRNRAMLELDEPEVYDVAIEMACLLIEEPSAASAAMEHFTAIANDTCANQEIPESRADDWRRICEMAMAPRPEGVSADAHFCEAVDMVNVARAVDAAAIQVYAATLRRESHALESGIEVGSLRAAREARETRAEREMEFVYGRINARYDVQSKQKSLKALSERQKKLKAQQEAARKQNERWNSGRARRARQRRRNIAEGILKADSKADPRWREHGDKPRK